jgi:Zn-finger domain-containing protein
MNIKIEYEREGSWLEFLLIDDEKMFEQMIADRREKIFQDKDTQAIEEMKKILNHYTKAKEEAEKEAANAYNEEAERDH